MRALLRIVTLLLSASVTACATKMPPEKQARLNGMVLYGYVNLSPSKDLTNRAMRDRGVKEYCELAADKWCKDPEAFDFINLLLMNTYTGGLRAVGTFAPSEQQVSRGDIVIVRFKAGTTAEFVRIASRGETENCRWDGGGVGRALTAAGVICEEYDWRNLRSYFYD